MIQALLLACSACLSMARVAQESDSSVGYSDSGSLDLLQEISELESTTTQLIPEAFIDADEPTLQQEKGAAELYYAGRHRGHYYDDSESSLESDSSCGARHYRHRPKPCPTTRCIRPSSTCCRRTTTDKVTTYILRRTTTTSFITSSITRVTTTTSISQTTSSTTLTSLTTTTSISTLITTVISSRTTTLPNTTFTVSRTATTTLPNKTVISIVTQQIMPCFTQFETCFYNCPYYEIDPNCGCACKPTGTPQPEQRHHRRHHRKGHAKAALPVEKAGNSKKPCGEKPHATIPRPAMPRARVVNCNWEPKPDCFARRSPYQPPVYAQHDYDAQPERCIINKLPSCMREGHRHRHHPHHDDCGCMPHHGCENPMGMAVANGYNPDDCGCSRVYVLPCCTSMATLLPTYEPIPDCGCWNALPPVTVTVTTPMPMQCAAPFTVTAEANVFCTTQIVCAYYTPLGA